MILNRKWKVTIRYAPYNSGNQRNDIVHLFKMYEALIKNKDLSYTNIHKI